MSTILRRPEKDEETGRYQHITPENAAWEYVGFEAYNLQAGQSLTLHDEKMETCIVVLSGHINAATGDKEWRNVGNRQSVFEDVAPYSVYIPNDQEISLNAVDNAEIAVCKAPGKGGHKARLITPDDVDYECRGEGSNTRHVYNILPENKAADSLLVVEVKTPSGNWSSYPPHKHDTDDIPRQSYLEETYYHRLNPPQGFAFQRVFTDDGSLDETVSVHDGDVVMVPAGYHPYGVPHGYTGYYLNVMAGPTRVWHFYNHPDHEWIMKG